MFDKIKSLKEDGLLRGSFVLFLMMGIFNAFNYLFQMSMARMLGPADYGVLAVLMSIVYIFGIPNEAVQAVVSRYTTKFNLKDEKGKIKNLAFKSLRKMALISIGIFSVFLAASFALSKTLKIDFLMLGITGLVIFYVFSIPVTRGVMQGRKKFLGLGFSMVIESLGKVVFSITLVLAGLKVFGAIAGLIAGGAFALIVSFFSIRDIILSKEEKGERFEGIYRYNLPVLIGVTSIVLIYSLDVILARMFFSPEISGKYAFVSLIGKVVIFSSLAISKVMFPLSSENFERGENSRSILRKALIIVFLISGAMLILCLAVPELLIKVISLGSSQYLDAASILFIVCLAFSFTSATNIIVTYSVSVNKIRKASVMLLLFVLIEVILLSAFHSNLISFSLALLAANFLMFIYSLFFVKR